MNKSEFKKIMLENYVTGDSVVDAIELRDKLHITTAQMNSAISNAIHRGYPLVCVDGKIFRAKNQKDFEKKLQQVWEMNKKTDTVEYAVRKNLINITDMEVRK